jgi:hypothetical protein
MNAASTGQLLPIARKVAADLNVVLTDAALTAEITAANPSSTANPDFSRFRLSGLNKIKHLQLMF